MEQNILITLVKKAKAGNKHALEELYAQFGRRVYFTALKITGSAADAEDILQDTFLTASQKITNLKSAENFGAWITRIAVNKCSRFLKKSVPSDENEDALESIPDDEEFIPDNFVDDKAKRKIIMDIIDNVLTPLQRQTVILYYFDGLSTIEIARVTDSTPEAVRVRLSTARAKIREAVLIYEEENKDKLHAIVPIPILAHIFELESEETELPKAAFIGVLQNMSDKINKNGGKLKMLSTVKGKVLLAASIAVIVAGGVVVTGCGNDDKDSSEGKETAAVTADKDSSADEESSSEEDEYIDIFDDESWDSEENSSDADPAAEANKQKAITFMTKLKEKDWEYVANHTDCRKGDLHNIVDDVNEDDDGAVYYSEQGIEQHNKFKKLLKNEKFVEALNKAVDMTEFDYEVFDIDDYGKKSFEVVIYGYDFNNIVEYSCAKQNKEIDKIGMSELKKYDLEKTIMTYSIEQAFTKSDNDVYNTVKILRSMGINFDDFSGECPDDSKKIENSIIIVRNELMAGFADRNMFAYDDPYYNKANSTLEKHIGAVKKLKKPMELINYLKDNKELMEKINNDESDGYKNKEYDNYFNSGDSSEDNTYKYFEKLEALKNTDSEKYEVYQDIMNNSFVKTYDMGNSYFTCIYTPTYSTSLLLDGNSDEINYKELCDKLKEVKAYKMTPIIVQRKDEYGSGKGNYNYIKSPTGFNQLIYDSLDMN